MTESTTSMLDLWSSAILNKSNAGRGSNGKQEAYGIKKLRALILELAVRGKLVAQDPNDEPASVLLERIAGEKARLASEGAIKTQPALTSVGSADRPYELPARWVWTRIGNVGISSTGKTPSTGNPEYYGGELPFIGPGQLTLTGEILGSDKSLTNIGGEQGVIAEPGDILMVCIGGSIGKSAITTSRVAFNQQINSIRPIFVSSELINYAINTPRFQKALLEKASGSATPIINRSKWEELLLPIPPMAEQHRIVAKIDELLALCDQLEQQQTQRIEAHETLVETLLTTVTRAASPRELTAAWTRIATHFDILLTSEHSIDQIERTIVQLAVMGKLAPQDRNDGDVLALLDSCDARRRAVAETDRRADLDPQPILSAEDRWEVPETWAWRGLGDLVLFVDYRGKTPPKQSSGVRLLTAKNVRRGHIDLSPEEFVSEEEYMAWMTRGFPKIGDVLFTTEAPLGNAAVVYLSERFALAQRVICFQDYGGFDPEFLVLQIMSIQFQAILDKNGTGMTAKGIKASKLKQLPVAIPPLAEQRRIVAKVGELTALCDALKERLSQAQTTQIHLADVIVEQAVV
jgi:type I restriction enzyme, S subunit